ncbi:uracil-DNA glycosylase family protein [Caminibacter mediatlanticus]|uniref:Uracil-DNA glycosylase superfamily protein n=1 Tax=Caminibacter mediatlanticus TB-2 TaxID=391592 RepID=A0AAI9AJI3_9BACT|nr:uracil-DNA glycosylase family protein [Caminibacter mediatlanticus]EDM24624.1 Uracil-DNA glycosylase superfamily protein [Caminibacter mediatlanticus TB-2]
MKWKDKLKDFYKKRKEYIKKYLNENIDFTDVFDPFLDNKTDNPIMIIGEAPGENEVKQKSPFVGKAGENLNYLISLSGLNRKKHFLITNAFPFRTINENKNRTPKISELKIASKLLEEEINIVKPSLILLLGNSSIKAFSYLVPEVKNLKKCGFYDVDTEKFGKIKIGICYHPSPLAFNRKEIRESLEKFFKSLYQLTMENGQKKIMK